SSAIRMSRPRAFIVALAALPMPSPSPARRRRNVAEGEAPDALAIAVNLRQACQVFLCRQVAAVRGERPGGKTTWRNPTPMALLEHTGQVQERRVLAGDRPGLHELVLGFGELTGAKRFANVLQNRLVSVRNLVRIRCRVAPQHALDTHPQILRHERLLQEVA